MMWHYYISFINLFTPGVYTCHDTNANTMMRKIKLKGKLTKMYNFRLMTYL